jgi:NAD(P)H-dependent flavin oxidoreductase YrpB (nitropropane dioxygenase family)
MGTRFLATPEAPATASHKRVLLDAAPESTVRSAIFDTLWGDVWPGVQARALRNRLATRWLGREQELLAARESSLRASCGSSAVLAWPEAGGPSR